MYNFDAIIPRWDTSCTKWDGAALEYGRRDIIPMWVADMDFQCPNPVITAIQKRAEHPIYGYSFPSDECYTEIIHYFKNKHNWDIKKEWIIFSHGVVDGINSAILGIRTPNDKIIVQQPVYYPFFSVIEHNNCSIINSPLVIDNGKYMMNFEDLENKLQLGARALLLCSPHNPVGRVWTKDELSKVAELCIKYNCILLSDEIHCDLVYAPAHHMIPATLNEEIAQKTISFYAVSKTYNTPGFTTAFMVIPNEELRNQVLAARMGQNGGNLFGYEAITAAYRDGEEYHDTLIKYLRKNIAYFSKIIKEKLPLIHVYQPEGTYLVWIDMRNYHLNEEQLNDKFVNECGLILDKGSMFGPEGQGFFRFNLSCPTAYIKEALDKMIKSFQ